jgi:uncharacterized membrane protein SirB2
MLEFYPWIKLVHYSAALCSGAFFTLRALALLSGMHWPRAAPIRYLSYSIDSVLLTAALMLLTILPSALFANGWLWVKIAFVLAYILLGIAAFRPQRANNTRAILLGAALLCFIQVYTIARLHQPWGVLWYWLR